MKNIIIWCALLSTCAISSCGGMRIAGFSSSTVDTPMPNYFTSRTVLSNPSEVKDDLPELLGKIIVIDSSGKAEIISGRMVLAKYRDTTFSLKPISDGTLYHSKVKTGFLSKAKGTYLASISVSDTGEHLYEVLIQDIGVARIKTDYIDWNRVYDFAKSPKPSGTVTRCLVTQALLANIQYRAFNSFDIKSEVAAGDIFAANAGYYYSVNAFTNDYGVSCQCLDLSKFSGQLNAIETDGTKEKEDLINRMRSALSDSGDVIINGFSTAVYGNNLRLKR